MNKKEKMISIKKPGLGVDIDETLSWTVGHWVKEMQKLFGNPEKLSIKGIVKKYGYAQHVPYWQSKAALHWMEGKRNSNEFQKELPLIKNSNHFLNKINKIVPIAAYITIRPESVREGTEHWLLKHRFPKARVICRPDKIPTEKGNKWKSKILQKLYPKILGFIDDSPGVINSLPKNYKGKIFHYNPNPVKSKLNVINCRNWPSVYNKIKKEFSD